METTTVMTILFHFSVTILKLFKSAKLDYDQMKEENVSGIEIFKFFLSDHLNLSSIYAGPNLFGTGTKLVRVGLVYTGDIVDLVRIGSAIWYQMGLHMKVILCGTVSFQLKTGPMQT